MACAEIFEGEHQVIMIEIGYVKERDPKWLLSIGGGTGRAAWA